MSAFQIHFTDAAKKHVQKMLEAKGKDTHFHLSVKKTGCSGYMYVPSVITNPDSNDIVVKNAEIPMCIDGRWGKILNGITVDYVSHRLGQYQLSFHNPHAKGQCGCGESFHLDESVEE